MGNFESDELPQQSNLQSFSSPYSPQFFLNKNDFKGQTIKQLMKQYLNSEFPKNNDDTKIEDTKDIKEIKNMNQE